MSCKRIVNLDLCSGEASFTVSSSAERFIPIVGITQAAPCVITATAHDLTDNWLVAFESVDGMIELNAQNSPPLIPDDYYQAEVIDADTFSLSKNGRDVHALDFGAFSTGNGVVRCFEREDFTDCTIGMVVYDSSGEVLDETVVPVIDVAEARITVTADADLKALLIANPGAKHEITITYPDNLIAVFSGKISA